MALDPKIAAFVKMPRVELLPPPAGVTAAMMRAAMKATPAPVVLAAIHQTEDIRLKTTAGSVAARLYRPSAIRSLPLIVYFHGGGFVLCDLDTHEGMCRDLANATGCVVASIDYRLAPETRFPGPVEDCYDALCALVAQADTLSIDPTRVAVAGDSAGANLAAVTAIVARDRGGPSLRHQTLIYPCLDPACESESMRTLSRGYFLTQDMMKWFWAQYLRSPEDAKNPLASPLHSTDLSGLPPTTLITAEYDLPRDEGELYGDRLRLAGVPVVGRRYLGMIHGFVSLPLVTEVAKNALTDLSNDIRAALFS